jgi:tRNA-splicing ligase RtcB
MGATRTSIMVTEETTRKKLRELVNNIKLCVPCGEGKGHKHPQEWEGFDGKLDALSDRQWMDKHTKKLAKTNLGSLGGGNHFIEIQADKDDMIWLMIHSGSRHMGNVIARHYHKLAVELNTKWKTDLPTTDLAFLPSDSDEGIMYIHDMNFALDYAKENRKRILNSVITAFQDMYPKAVFDDPINIHHNYAAIEHHFNKNVWVHRKGATSAREDEMGIIPGSMGTPSFIVKGLGNPESYMSCSHGAGRVFGRNDASKRFKPEECDKAMGQIVYDRWNKIRRGKMKGLYDLGEAPQAYKDIHSVIDAQKDLVIPVVQLRPLAVVKG